MNVCGIGGVEQQIKERHSFRAVLKLNDLVLHNGCDGGMHKSYIYTLTARHLNSLLRVKKHTHITAPLLSQSMNQPQVRKLAAWRQQPYVPSVKT